MTAPVAPALLVLLLRQNSGKRVIGFRACPGMEGWSPLLSGSALGGLKFQQESLSPLTAAAHP